MPSHYLPIRRTRGFRGDLTASPDPLRLVSSALCPPIPPSARLGKHYFASCKYISNFTSFFAPYAHSFPNKIFSGLIQPISHAFCHVQWTRLPSLVFTPAGNPSSPPSIDQLW